MGKAIIIDIDEFKEKISGYDPRYADKWHTESARMANKEFDKVIKEPDYRMVVLMNGGSASGKSEFVRLVLNDKNIIVFDSTLSTELGSEVKYRNIISRRKVPFVISVIPEDLSLAFQAFTGRKRRFDAKHFIRTHSGSRRVIKHILENHEDVGVRIYTSRTSLDLKLGYSIFQGDSVNMLQYVNSIQKTEDEIEREILSWKS